MNAFESRIMLFEGTWQKYREGNTELAKKYLEAAKTAANRVMSAQKYKISSDYKALTISLDLAGNPEMILYRSYVEGILTHAEMSWQSEQTLGNGPSKDLVDSYLTTNGLPIHQDGNTVFKGDKVFKDEMTDRDPRLAANIDLEGVRLMVLQVRYMVLEVILVLVLLTKIYSILLQDRVILIQPTHLL